GLAEQVMHIQPSKFGYIVAAAGLGMSIGNVWVAKSAGKVAANLLVYIGFSGLGLFMTLLGTLGFILVYMFPYLGLSGVYFGGCVMYSTSILYRSIGISCVCVVVPIQAALQSSVPEELRGKVFGSQSTAMSAASTIPVILAGMSSDNLPGGVSTTLLLLGVP